MKYMRRTAGYIWTDYKTNAQIAKELKITPILEKLLEYKRNWIQHVNRMPRNRLARVMKRYSPTGRRNHGRPFKRLLDTWDRNGSTSGPTPWQIYDDNDDDATRSYVYDLCIKFHCPDRMSVSYRHQTDSTEYGHMTAYCQFVCSLEKTLSQQTFHACTRSVTMYQNSTLKNPALVSFQPH